MAEVARLVLMFLRLVVFALALGLTVISFQAYNQQRSKRLESAFIGFSFISMGVALTSLRTQADAIMTYFQIAETVPFIVGFAMLYVSLYR